jgi:hypothetical protein
MPDSRAPYEGRGCGPGTRPARLTLGPPSPIIRRLRRGPSRLGRCTLTTEE